MAQISTYPTVVILVLLLGVSGFSVPALAIAAPTDVSSSSKYVSSNVWLGQKTTNNSTDIQHKDPSEVQSEEELANLEQWLAGQLGSRLAGSTTKLSQGEYQAANSMVGDQYNNLLSKYVEVAGRTEGTGDDQQANEFKSAKKNQEQYTSKVGGYRRTYEEYQRAKENGNDREARRLARKLNNISSSINQTGGNLTKNYQNVSDSTGSDFSPQRETVQETTDNITDQQAEIRATEFVKTEISAEPESSESSYLDPITVSGELVDENGTELSDETIRLQLGGNRSTTTTTDGDGDFTITGRPAILPLGEQSLTLEHVPNTSSVYLGSNTTVDTEIEQVRPTVTVSQHPDHGRYNKSITVSGRLHADDIGDKDIPIIVKSGSTVIGNTTTQEDGSFTLTENLPAAIPAGNQQIQVSIPVQEQALAFASTEAPITIHPTNTSLNVTSQYLSQNNIVVNGTLTTATGMPLPNQTVILRANGTQIGTVTTDPNGTYTKQMHLPASLGAENNTHLSLSAIYTGNETNLNAAQTNSFVRLQPKTDASNSFWLWAGIAGVGVLLTVGGFVIQRSSWFTGSEEPTEPEMFEDQFATDADEEELEETTGATIREWADQAATALSENEFQTAIEMAYTTGRQYYLTNDETISEAGRTHWEFYRLCEKQDFTEREIEQLRQLTLLYEQATFTTQTPARKDAETAVELADTYASEMTHPASEAGDAETTE